MKTSILSKTILSFLPLISIFISILSFLSIPFHHAMGFELKITSNPEQATIFIIDLQGQKKIKIGETPKVVPLDDLFNLQIKESAIILEIVKEGYQPYRVVVPDLGTDNDIIMSVTLESEKLLEKQKEMDVIITQLFEIQRLIRAKQYGEAEEMLKLLETKAVGLSIVPEMQGMVKYVQGNFDSALDFFKRSFVINPQNELSAKMIKYLENALGVQNRDPNTNN